MAQITISEGLGWLKILRERHAELVALRNQNSNNERYFLGSAADKTIDKTPVYSVKKLDVLVGNLAREIRILDAALKKTNATQLVQNYNQDDAVLGVVE